MRKIISALVGFIASVFFGLLLNELIGNCRMSVCLVLLTFGLVAGVSSAYIAKKEE